MSFRDLLLLKRLSVGVLSFTGALVLLVGAGLIISAFSSPPDLNEIRPVATEFAKRGPSSIRALAGPALFVAGVDNRSVETVALGCLQNGQRMEHKSAAKHLRITGRLCNGQSFSVGTSSVVNRANGFEATLFKLAQSDFTSDYISLAAGTNTLLMQIEDGKGGRAVAEITVSLAQ